MVDPKELTDRYVSLWNEPDPASRRTLITEPWAPDGANLTPTSEYHGYQELEVRVSDAYEKFVGSGRYRFRSVHNAAAHHHAVRFNWEMYNPANDEVASVGLEVFILDADGRIITDHQFIEQ
jgi:hypothetical protein